MKLIAYLLLPGLAVTSHASAAIKATANFSFDDITGSAIPSPVSAYKHITYNAFSLADVGGEVVKDLQTHTPPNAIVTDSEQQSSSGTPSLTVEEPYTSFGLTDFYFGCTTHTDEAAANLATQCTITVDAFKHPLDKQFTTPPFTSLVQQLDSEVLMFHAVLPDTFQDVGITNVTIIQDDPIMEVLLLNSISYYLYE